MAELYTIGYEGANVDQLVQTLKNLGIEVLADVRELPLSRKKGLSKNKLAERLTQEGIQYVHYKKLGDPKPGRDAAKSGNFAEFERVFLNHLNQDETQEALSELLLSAKEKKTCMLCFERCSTTCHRSYLADQAASVGFKIFNLVADSPEKYSHDCQIPRYHPRQSLTAAE